VLDRKNKNEIKKNVDKIQTALKTYKRDEKFKKNRKKRFLHVTNGTMRGSF